MNRISELFTTVFAAAAFAEHGEWDEARRIYDGSQRTRQADARKQQRGSKKDKRAGSSRPQLRL